MKNHFVTFALAAAASGVTLYFLHKLYSKKILMIKKQFHDRYTACKNVNQSNKQKIEILGKFTGHLFN